MISGKLELGTYPNQWPSYSLFVPTAICQALESALATDEEEVSAWSGGNGFQYTANESWVGIDGAAICAGAATSKYDITGGLPHHVSGRALLLSLGYGLVVEVDVNRLPGDWVHRCSFTVQQDALPYYVSNSLVIGNSGVIVVRGETFPITWTESPSASYFWSPASNPVIIQGICAK